MKKAVIVYHSSTGTTENYARDIGKYLEEKGLEVQITSTSSFKEDMMDGSEFILFGCWTNGLFIMAQKPDSSWVEFASKLPPRLDPKVALFTTYKILTGSMFRKMAKELKGKFAVPTLELKSRGPILTEKNRLELDQFLS